MDQICSSCGANWGAGSFSEGCAECGGGAMERACQVCGGVCGAIWRRAVLDSNDAGEAFWIGSCSRYSDNHAAVQSEWWRDASALPDNYWAQLIVENSGAAVVKDLDGVVHRFPNRESAVAWLREDEYEPVSKRQGKAKSSD